MIEGAQRVLTEDFFYDVLIKKMLESLKIPQEMYDQYEEEILRLVDNQEMKQKVNEFIRIYSSATRQFARENLIRFWGNDVLNTLPDNIKQALTLN